MFISGSKLTILLLGPNWGYYILFDLAVAYPSAEVEQPIIILSTANNLINGFTGCNAFGSKAKFTLENIMVNDTIEAHQQLCVGKWEVEFFDALRNIKSYRFEQGDLKLISRNKNSMTFRKSNGK